ncbi:MAG: hypothetical protein LBL07_13045 [Tannerella sp.]|nr:hypothetical protein [Tannerella sp.]
MSSSVSALIDSFPEKGRLFAGTGFLHATGGLHPRQTVSRNFRRGINECSNGHFGIMLPQNHGAIYSKATRTWTYPTAVLLSRIDIACAALTRFRNEWYHL